MSGFQCAMCENNSSLISVYIDDDLDLPVRRCTRCTHIQRWPLPSQEQLDATFAAQTQRKTRLPGMKYEQKRRHVLGDTERRLNFAIQVLDGQAGDEEHENFREKKALDIGTGEGFFAAALRPYVRDIQTTEYASQLKPGTDHDLVTAHHVLEHVHDPLSTARYWWSLVQQGGDLIIEVPNVQDYMVPRCDAYRAWHFQEAHLHYFSVQTLLSVLQRLEGNPRVEIRGIQRYSHMHQVHWMEHGTPWEMPIPPYPAKSEASEYRKDLEATFACDTLYAVVRKDT